MPNEKQAYKAIKELNGSELSGRAIIGSVTEIALQD
jgi:RNA recognition motif-containing protein